MNLIRNNRPPKESEHGPKAISGGFTLIELLVVIAIIAILAAILFPVFAQAKLSAKKIVGLSDQKQLTMATLMYLNDYDDTFPNQGYGTPCSTTGCDSYQPAWGFHYSFATGQVALVMANGEVAPYLKAPQEIILEPTAPPQSHIYPWMVTDPTTLGSISLNYYLLGANAGQAEDPAETAMHIDTIHSFDPVNGIGYYTSGAAFPFDQCSGPQTIASYNGVMNASWVDGHAKPMHQYPVDAVPACVPNASTFNVSQWNDRGLGWFAPPGLAPHDPPFAPGFYSKSVAWDPRALNYYKLHKAAATDPWSE